MTGKTKFTQTFILAGLFLTFISCEAIKEKLAVDVPIKNVELSFEVQPAVSQAPMQKAPSQAAETKVLLDRTYDVNIEDEAAKLGYDLDNIIGFVMTSASIELVEPLDFNLNEFKNLKIYFDNQTNLVAQADKIGNGKIEIKIVNGDLLQKLKEDQLHIIIVGDTMPTKKVKLKFISNYTAKINIFK